MINQQQDNTKQIEERMINHQQDNTKQIEERMINQQQDNTKTNRRKNDKPPTR